MTRARTLLDKIWDAHAVVPETEDHPAILYIDLHLLHEVTSHAAFETVSKRGLTVRRPDLSFALCDHAVPTRGADSQGRLPFVSPATETQARLLEENCARHGIECRGALHPGRGIVHVVAPELGLTLPGSTVVCGDSHTCTHGAFGALAFGIGSSEVGYVLATQCLLARRPASVCVRLDGTPEPHATAKDIALAVLAALREETLDALGSFVIEFQGPVVDAFSMEERMTLCNLAIEAGARSGLVAPDETTFRWLDGRPRAPRGPAFAQAVAQWKTLASDPGARHARTCTVRLEGVGPRLTYGTTPAENIPIDAPSPHANAYMSVEEGALLLGRPVDVVFIGSCTNGRLSDLRAAAQVLKGGRVAPGVACVVVPGSGDVKAAAEAEGLHEVFLAAGAQWREPGCSFCVAMNGDALEPGQTAVSTSNRNFEGRQGPRSHTFLASPATAAACALAGRIADPRVSARASGGVS